MPNETDDEAYAEFDTPMGIGDAVISSSYAVNHRRGTARRERRGGRKTYEIRRDRNDAMHEQAWPPAEIDTQ